MGERRGRRAKRRGTRLVVLAAFAGALGMVRKQKLDTADAAMPEASSRVG